MFKSSAALAALPSPPRQQQPDQPMAVPLPPPLPVGAFVSSRGGAQADNPPRRDPKTAGQDLGRYLHGNPSAQGVAEHLKAMAHGGVHTLDLSAQVVGADAVLLLVEVFKAQPFLLSRFTAFNFSDARFDVLSPLLDVLGEHPGGWVESLDLSGTRALSRDAMGTTAYAPLEDADLRRVVAIVKSHAGTLRELQLNQQTGLSPALGERAFDHVIDTTAPMFALASALHQSAVEKLELRDCDLWACDVNCLDPQALFRGQPLAEFRFQVIDLRGNDRMFGCFDSPVLRAQMVIGQTVGLAANPALESLYLPSKTLFMIGDNAGVAYLTRALELAAPRHLVKLEPFFSSSAERFEGLNRLLKGPQGVVCRPVVGGAEGSSDVLSSDPTVAGRGLALYLHQNPSPDGVAARLDAMLRQGVQTLDFSHQTFSAEAVLLLCGVFQQQPALLSGFFGFHFADARFDIVWPLLDVLQGHKGGYFESMDFSGTCVLTGHLQGTTWYAPLQDADLRRIVAIVQSHRFTLGELKLNQQSGLSSMLDAWRPDELIDPNSAMHALARALCVSAVTVLELRDCDLWAIDVNCLNPDIFEIEGVGQDLGSDAPEAPVRGLCLRSLDLRGNHGMFVRIDDPAMRAQQVLLQIAGLASNPCLEVLHLPSNAPALLDSEDALAELTRALAKKGSRHLVRLEPFSASDGLRVRDLKLLRLGQRKSLPEDGEDPLSSVPKPPLPNVRSKPAPRADEAPEPPVEPEPLSLAPQKPLPPLPFEPLPQPMSEPMQQATLAIDDSPKPSPTKTDRMVPTLALGPLNAATAGPLALACLEGQDDQSFIRFLYQLRNAGIRVLDFSRQRISATAAAQLARIVARWPAVLTGRLDALEFRGAEFDDLQGLRRLIEVLATQRGIGLSTLDFSGTHFRCESDCQLVVYHQRLPRDLLLDIVRLARVCPTLRVLKLNQQQELSGGNDEEAGVAQLFGLVPLLRNTSLTSLEIRGCARRPSDPVSDPVPVPSPMQSASEARPSPSRMVRVRAPTPLARLNTPQQAQAIRFLKSIDLRDNESAFAGDPRRAGLLMVRLVRSLACCELLEEVFLPPAAIEALNRCDDLAFEVLFELTESRHPHCFKLQAEAPPEEAGGVSLLNMLSVLNSTVLRSPIEASMSTDVHARLHGSLSGLFKEKIPGTLDRRQRLIDAIGTVLGGCFRTGDAQGAIERLLLMTGLGIQTLSLKAQTLGKDEQACLARVLDTCPLAFTVFDFREAEVEDSLLIITTALKRQMRSGGRIESLNFSGTTIRTRQMSGQSKVSALSTVDLNSISEIVRSCKSLRVLNLDHQHQLSQCKPTGIRLFKTAADWPMMALVEALTVASLEQLSLRDCDLKFEDLQLISIDRRPMESRRNPLWFVDLSHNSKLYFGAREIKSIRAIKDLIEGFPNLRELYLPAETLALFGDEAAQRFTTALRRLKQASPIGRIEPLSSSTLPSLSAIKELLGTLQLQHKT